MIHHGDCLEVMRTLADNSVDAVVTDPPYGWRFMGKAWDGADIEKFAANKERGGVMADGKARKPRDLLAESAGTYDVSISGNQAFQEFSRAWAFEAFRILKPGGHMLVFCGPRTYHRMASGVEDAGFEIRDQLQWIFGSGFPKSHNLDGEHEGWGTALKPANEPIVLARKPLSESTVAKNVLKWGVGALNIDGSRIAPSTDYGRSAANSRGTINAHSGFEGKSFKISERDAEYANPQGRWPANVLFDEEAAIMLDEQSGLCKSGGSSSGRGFQTEYVGGKVENEVEAPYAKDKGAGASRFFYCAKASKSERNRGLENETKSKEGTRPNSPDNTGKFPDHDQRTTGGNNHPTVKPIKLMEYLCRLITPNNGTILDPFAGSGTTGLAACNLGFNFIGIEMNKDYVEIAQKRIESSNSKQLELV